MEKLFMSAGVVTAIVLCLIGIIKLPFDKFKQNHSNGYKALFTCLTFVVAVGLSVLDELYILCGDIISVDFAILVCVVLTGVFGGYNGVYEGLGLKELVKKLIENIKQARDMAQSKKAVEYLNKIDDIDSAIKVLEKRKKAIESVDIIQQDKNTEV